MDDGRTVRDVVEVAPGIVETEMRHKTSPRRFPGAGPPSSGCHVPEEMEVEVDLRIFF